MSGKKKTVFAMDSENRLFVQVRAVMHPMIPFIDGLTIHRFKQDKWNYMLVADAIEWIKRELVYAQSGYRKELELKLNALTTAGQKVSQGKINFL